MPDLQPYRGLEVHAPEMVAHFAVNKFWGIATEDVGDVLSRTKYL